MLNEGDTFELSKWERVFTMLASRHGTANAAVTVGQEVPAGEYMVYAIAVEEDHRHVFASHVGLFGSVQVDFFESGPSECVLAGKQASGKAPRVPVMEITRR